MLYVLYILQYNVYGLNMFYVKYIVVNNNLSVDWVYFRCKVKKVPIHIHFNLENLYCTNIFYLLHIITYMQCVWIIIYNKYVCEAQIFCFLDISIITFIYLYIVVVCGVISKVQISCSIVCPVAFFI